MVSDPLMAEYSAKTMTDSKTPRRRLEIETVNTQISFIKA